MRNSVGIPQNWCRSLRCFALLACALGACSKKHKTQSSDLDPERNGSSVPAVGGKYSDQMPSLSSNGTRVVFLSGRESPETGVVLKAFKASWPPDGEPAAPEAVTALDLGTARETVLSPDGAHIALVAFKEGRTDLWLAAFEGARDDARDSSDEPVRISDDEVVESSPIFSAAGGAGVSLLWIAREDDQSTVRVVGIGDGSAASLAESVALPTNGHQILAAFWLPGTETLYHVVVLERDGLAGELAAVTYKFDDPATADRATPEAWGPAVGPLTVVKPSAAVDAAAFVVNVMASERLVAHHLGDYPVPDGEATPTSPVRSRALFLSGDGSGAKFTSADPPTVLETMSLSLTADGVSAFLLGRHVVRCDGDKDPARFTFFVKETVAEEAAPTYFAPRLAANGRDWEMARSVCDRKRPDDTVARLDDKLVDAVFNGDATPTAFRVAYVSRFSSKFDDSCVLKTADTEIRLVDAQVDTYKIYELSKNQAPLTDDDRGDDGPCEL